MHIKVKFKLHGKSADMARALHDQVRREVDPYITMDEIVRRQFIGWMLNNIVDTTEVQPPSPILNNPSRIDVEDGQPAEMPPSPVGTGHVQGDAEDGSHT